MTKVRLDRNHVVFGILFIFFIGISVYSYALFESHELKEQIRNIKSTKYFIFHYGDNEEKVDYLSRCADGFIDAVSKDFFKANFSYPIHAYVFKDSTSFNRYCKIELNEPRPLYGTYVPNRHSFYTYQDSGLGTFAHEIMHPLMEFNFPNAPAWCNEGIPTFFEKIFGYFEKDQITLNYGYQNPWRIKGIHEKILHLDLKDLVQGSSNSRNESEMRMLSVFIYQNGLLKKYFDLLRNKPKMAPVEGIESLFRKSIAEIQVSWKKYLEEVDKNSEILYEIPMSYIAPDARAYDQFLKEHAESMKSNVKSKY